MQPRPRAGHARRPPPTEDVDSAGEDGAGFAPAVFHIGSPKGNGRRLALDLFSGVGRVAKCMRKSGWSVEEVDIVHGDTHDITKPRVVRKLCQRIRNHTYDAAMIAAPCTSFSVARDRTCIIRTKREPWGLADQSRFSANDLAALQNGNRITKAVIKILNALTQAQVPWILENPRSSRMWHLPELLRLSQSRHAVFATGDFCQYGTKWRKRTGFLCMHCNAATVSRLLGKRCTGSSGLCSRTGCRHMLLQGSGAGGKPLTLIAQPYPPRLAAALSSSLVDAAE